jgi:hypothetical protein
VSPAAAQICFLRVFSGTQTRKTPHGPIRLLKTPIYSGDESLPLLRYCDGTKPASSLKLSATGNLEVSPELSLKSSGTLATVLLRRALNEDLVEAPGSRAIVSTYGCLIALAILEMHFKATDPFFPQKTHRIWICWLEEVSGDLCRSKDLSDVKTSSGRSGKRPRGCLVLESLVMEYLENFHRGSLLNG